MARVLIVDDDRAIRELLQIALELEGYETLAFRNGRQVVELLAESTGRGQTAEPDIILMDMMMPEMDGWAVCRYLEAHSDLLTRHPVVLMSAAATPGDEFPALARALLCKPFDLNHLLRLIASLGSPTTVATPRDEADAIHQLEAHTPVALLAS